MTSQSYLKYHYRIETIEEEDHLVVDYIEATIDVVFFVFPLGIIIFIMIIKALWGR